MASNSTVAFAYQERAVAFIDVLGFTDLVRRSDRDPTALAQVSELLAIDELVEKFVGQFLRGLAKATFFSDSFVLSVASPENWLFHLVREAGYLCRYLLLHGFPCRGSIVVGPLHHEGRFVVGPSFLNAYRLEQSVSFFPRVILDDAAMAGWMQEFRLVDGQGPAHREFEGIVKQDRDGCYFLDLFNARWPAFLPWTDFVPSFDPVPTDHVEFLRRVRRLLNQRLVDHANEPKIFQKYSWLAAEFNQSAELAGVPLCGG